MKIVKPFSIVQVVNLSNLKIVGKGDFKFKFTRVETLVCESYCPFKSVMREEIVINKFVNARPPLRVMQILLETNLMQCRSPFMSACETNAFAFRTDAPNALAFES